MLQKACIKIVARTIHTYLFFLYIYSPVLPQNKVILQAFTNCMHGYYHEHNMHPSNVMRTWKSVHSIDSSMSKLFEFTNLFVFFFALRLDDFIMYYFLWGLYLVKTVNCPLVLLTCHNQELLFTCPHRPLRFKKIRKTTTTVFLISKTVVPNPYSHSITFNPQSCAHLS